MEKIWAKLKGFKKKYLIMALILAVVAAGGAYAYRRLAGKQTAATVTYTAATVQRGDVEVKISGSGTVEPVSRFEIISLVKGEILSCAYEEGDTVKAGDVLYKIDSTDLQNNIQKQYNNIEKQQMTLKTNADNLAACKVRAPSSGTLTDFTLKVNDTAGSGKIATIVNNDSFIATVPFNASQLSQIHIGDSATVTSALYMTTINGTVTYKSNSASSSSDGSILYDVEITLSNPGALAEGVSVGATVHTSSGDVKSPASGKLENGGVTSVIPGVSGKVTKVYVRNNQYVKEGDLLFQIDDTDYANAQTKANIEYSDLQLSLQSYTKELDNYNITAPIDGVVLSKSYKVGDTIGSSSNSSATLMTVADTSKMVFNLAVDELEISSVQVGQTADITADALPNETFTGAVTKIAKEGTSSNGVTTYQVELTIEAPGGLISGMNVNAEIIIQKAENALYLPVAAVTNITGERGFVLVKDDSAVQPGEGAAGTEGMQGERPQMGDGTGQGRRQQGGDGTDRTAMPQMTEPPAGSQSVGAAPARQWGQRGMTAPDGYQYVMVTIGLTNDDSVEIKSGLSEGDEVYIATVKSSSTATQTQRSGNNTIRMSTGIGGGGGGFSGGGPPMGGGR